MGDDELDFLSDDENNQPQQAVGGQLPWHDAVEPVRGEMLDWAAAALHGRCAEAAVYRGRKGMVQCRLDLDRMLKQLLAVPPDQALAALQGYRRWAIGAIWQPRGSSAATLDAGAAVLAEALVRFAVWPAAVAAADVLIQAVPSSAEAVARGEPLLQSAVAERLKRL